MAHLTSYFFNWESSSLARYDYESILHRLSVDPRGYLGSISWQELLASGVAAMKPLAS